MASRKRARVDDIPSPSTPAPPSTTIGPDVQSSQTLVPMLQSLFQGQAAPPEPTPAWVEPVPADPQSPVANPPSPAFEVVPQSPPIIIISDSPSGEAAAPPDSPTGEAADLSNSLSGEAITLFDSLVFHLIDEEEAQTQDT
ncbi:hypothetical protein JHK86_000870 [Glycine max]|nr:hypothetical protein JHK86_000870 [Glycine max]